MASSLFCGSPVPTLTGAVDGAEGPGRDDVEGPGKDESVISLELLETFDCFCDLHAFVCVVFFACAFFLLSAFFFLPFP